MANASRRQQQILQLIPVLPNKITAAQIQARLVSERLVRAVSRRTIERDLNELSGDYPVVHDEEKPQGWSVNKGAVLPQVLDPSTALAFKVLDLIARDALPPFVARRLKPYLDHADQVLRHEDNASFLAWLDKIAVVPNGYPLVAPAADTKLGEVVYQALLQDKQFTAAYRNTRGETKEHARVHPHGLVLRSFNTLYLVATLNSSKMPVQLALHRFVSAKLLSERRVVPPAFDFKDFVRRGHLGIVVGPETLPLVVRVTKRAGGFLHDMRMGEDQSIVEHDDHLVVRATVANRRDLRWFLAGFMRDLEILEPAELRAQFAADFKHYA